MTIDMTNNRVPYGLLTDEEKAALRAHEKAGGEFVFHLSGGSWHGTPTVCCTYTDWIYRTVPLPKTQDVIAWDRLPDWVEWVMRNNSGEVWVYDAERFYSFNGRRIRIDDFPGIVQIGTVDWKESKQRRPRG
jgi:hypothetical protein